MGKIVGYARVSTKEQNLDRQIKALEKYGYHPEFNNIEEWNKAIQIMIDAFELMKFPNSLHSKQDQGTIKQGFDLFCKYFIYLWG